MAAWPWITREILTRETPRRAAASLIEMLSGGIVFSDDFAWMRWVIDFH